MGSPHPWLRAVGVFLLIPISFAIAIKTQNIQVILFVISLLYAIIAGGYLWFVLLDNSISIDELFESEDLLLRRGATWALILFVIFITTIITGAFIAGIVTVLIVYAGGLFDQASLHVATRDE